MKNKNYKYLEEFNRWCNGQFLFDLHYDFNLCEYYLLTEIDSNNKVVLYNGGIRHMVVKEKGETTEQFLKKIYGKTLECAGKIYHFPHSFEELCIMNDLNGR